MKDVICFYIDHGGETTFTWKGWYEDLALFSVEFRIAFREYCKDILTPRKIDEIFSEAGLLPGSIDQEKLQRISGERRTRIEEYYSSIDWDSKRDVQKFLKVLTSFFRLYYPEDNTFKDWCREEGFLVDGNTVSFKPEEGVSSNVKNLIFAAVGLKPDIVLQDALSNEIKIVKNEQNCLVYDRDIAERGLYWKDLIDWWRDINGADTTEESLYGRLYSSLQSVPEKLLFETYRERVLTRMGYEIPALIPQVYLHYDPYTIKQLAGEKRLIRQRMDFLLLLSRRRRIVLEVDGLQHYSKQNQEKQDIASPELYAEMVSEDRRLRLLGYEIYRFGGYELQRAKGKDVVETFFRTLFKNGI